MSKEEILEIFNNGYTYEDLAKQFKKSELSEMYKIISDGTILPSSYKKINIAFAIFKYWKAEKRIKALFKNLK